MIFFLILLIDYWWLFWWKQFKTVFCFTFLAALFNNHGNGALFQQANNEDEIKKLKFTIFKKYNSETDLPKQEEEEGIHYIRGNFNDLFNEGRVLGEVSKI